MDDFDKIELADARREAAKAGVALGKLTTYRVRSMSRPGQDWREVWEKDRGLIWQGKANSAASAKAAAITERIHQATNTKP